MQLATTSTVKLSCGDWDGVANSEEMEPSIIIIYSRARASTKGVEPRAREKNVITFLISGDQLV